MSRGPRDGRLVVGDACPACNAPIDDRTHRFCAYCGAALPLEELPGAGQSRVERFEALAAHPAAREAREAVPDLSVQPVHATSGCAITAAMAGTVVVGFGALALSPASFVLGNRLLVFLVLVALVGSVLAGVAISAGVRPVGRHGLPRSLRRTHVWDARVADTRNVTVRRGNGVAALLYAILESADGRRSEFLGDGPGTYTVAPDDMGVARTRGRRLLSFHRVDV